MSRSERYELMHEIFTRACALTGDDRRAYLDEACLEAQDLRNEVERLLAADERASARLETPALGGRFDLHAAATALGPDAKLVGQRIGRYHLRRVIASGGMGTVYEATQENPHRTVAVKVMKPGLASRSSLRRFEYEAQVLARLRHHGVAQVFEAATSDEADGLPYFVMEYVPGALPLTEYADSKAMSLPDRLVLFASICDAVSHGHQKGIIHRDLKPANILVDANGQPKVIDFGVARATDSDMALTTLQTDVGQLIGTLQYMSPEQCEADPHALDTRSDVYSLGVVLYELLCGHLPYDVARVAVHEAARVVRETPPARPSTIKRSLRGDLETIALKALEKDRDRRYQSASDLAADIRRYLHDEPINARPPSAVYQIRKFAKRHRALVGSLAAVFVTLVAAFVVTALALSRESEQRQLAERRDEEAQRQRAIAESVTDFLQNGLLRAVSPDHLGHEVSMREALDAASVQLSERDDLDPAVRAALHETIGNTYKDLGVYDQVETHLVRAVELYETTLGPDDETTIEVTTNLAGFYEAVSRYDDAEALLAPLLERTRTLLGDEHLRTASILTELGHIESARGNYAAAEAHHREALPIYRSVTGERSADAARCLSNLGSTLRRQVRNDEAEPLFTDAIEIMTEVEGETHPQTLQLVNNLGVLYYSTGRYAEAAGIFRDLLEKSRAALPENHPDTLIIELNLATNLGLSGEHEEALRIEEDLLPRMVEAMGETDYYTIVLTNNVANSYRRAGRLDEAEANFHKAIERLAAINPEHHQIAMVLNGLAHVHLERQDYAEADKCYAELLERHRKQLPEQHPTMLQMRLGYANSCLKPWGRFDDAERELLGALEVSREHYGDANNGSLRLAESLVALYEQWDRPDDAAHWRAWLEEAGARAADG